LVFYAAFAVGKLGELSERINSPKIADLRGTSAVMNYFAGVDHRGRIAGKLRQKKPINLIEIGESIHAQIPRIYWAMNDVLRRSDGGKRLSGGLAHLIDVINRQMIAGADYIAVNVDAFPQRERPGLMRQYVNLVNSLSAGVGGMPVCIDSSDPVTKQAGLEAYYRTAENPREKPPIINSINIIDPQPILELKADHDFKVIAMLHDKIDAAGNPANVGNVDEVHDLARELFDLLVKTGFAPDDIFFDTAVVPIATDIDGTNTYKTMHGVARIMSDPAMKGVHTVIGLSNCSHMMPNRIAINRAYLQVAMEHGLDAAVLDPTIDYGMKDPGKQILSIITALAENDGTDAMKGFEIFEQIAEYSRKYGKTSNLVRGRSSSPPYQGGVRGG
jgi:5-methyltetrahydrofolate--homocysteine methyltransferase